MSFEIDDDALKNILAEVGALVEPIIKSEAKNLNKADGDEPPAEAKEEDSPPVEESTPAPEGSPAPAEASPAGGPPPGMAGPAAGAPPAGPEGGDGLPDDPAALMDMMAQLPPEKLKAIYMASKQALLAMKGAAGPAGAPPPPPPAPEASAPPAGPGGPGGMPPAMKGEMKASSGNGGKMTKKSEADVDELKALVKTQGEKITLLTTAITQMANTPVRKAITSVSALSKTEVAPAEISLTQKEVADVLNEKIRSGMLSKKEKESVRKYYDQGCKNLNLVANLLQ